MSTFLDRTALQTSLEASTGEPLEVTTQFLRADGGRFYAPDFLVIGAAKRALSLSTAMFMLLDQEHTIAAATLARPHLGTLLRLHSLWLVAEVGAHVMAVMAGERLDKCKDRQGRRLTDRFLVETLSTQPDMAWVASVYERTSGFVHLSEAAIFQTLSGYEDENRSGTVTIEAAHKASLDDEMEMKSFAVRVNREVASRVVACSRSKSAGAAVRS